MRNPAQENRYCPCIRQTVRHTRQGEALVCQRCGSAKYPVVFIRNVLRGVGTTSTHAIQ